MGADLRVRADTFGYLQRSFAGLVSEVDASEAREVGRTALRVATGGEHRHGTVVIRRASQDPYEAAFEVAKLSDVAKHTRDLDEGFLSGDNDVSQAFMDYVRPLVGDLPQPGRLSDHPLG